MLSRPLLGDGDLGQQRPAWPLPLRRARVMDILPLSGWQVVQEPDEGLTVLLGGVHAAVLDDELESQLRKALAGQGAAVPRLTVRRVAEIPKTASGKTP